MGWTWSCHSGWSQKVSEIVQVPGEGKTHSKGLKGISVLKTPVPPCVQGVGVQTENEQNHLVSWIVLIFF